MKEILKSQSINIEIITESLYEMNETQLEKLADYAMKLYRDKRYKKNKLKN